MRASSFSNLAIIQLACASIASTLRVSTQQEEPLEQAVPSTRYKKIVDRSADEDQGSDGQWVEVDGSKTECEAYWWLDRAQDNAFTFFDLNGFYPQEYFEGDHVDVGKTNGIATTMARYYKMLTERTLNSIAEFGGAGGWFTKAFHDHGWDYQSVEGTTWGVKQALNKALDAERIHRGDLRLPLVLPPPTQGGKFNMAMCTEVAEHIEMPFLSTLVETLTKHADLIWFSHATVNQLGKNIKSMHHSSELPLRFWLNLFEFHGYGALLLSQDMETKNDVRYRGNMILYRRSEMKQLFPQGLSRFTHGRVKHTNEDLHILPSHLNQSIASPPEDWVTEQTALF